MTKTEKRYAEAAEKNICPSCGIRVPLACKHCARCGQQMRETKWYKCPVCEATPPSLQDNFCIRCGNSLDPVKEYRERHSGGKQAL